MQLGGRPARLSNTNRLVAGRSDYIIPDVGCQKARRLCRFTPAAVKEATCLTPSSDRIVSRIAFKNR